MYILNNYSHEYKTRRIFELWIKSCYHSSFSERNSSCTLLLHQPTSPSVVFLPCLVFSLMRCPNTSFLQDYCFYLHSSLGYSFVLFSPMSNLAMIHFACQVNLIIFCCGIHQMMSSMSCHSVEVFF